MGRLQDKEWTAWKEICKQIEVILNIDSEELNKRKDIKDLCILIARWGHHNTILNRVLISGGMSEEKAKPVFANMKLSTEKVDKK